MMQLSLQVEADRWRSSCDGDKVMVANADLRTAAVAKDDATSEGRYLRRLTGEGRLQEALLSVFSTGKQPCFGRFHQQRNHLFDTQTSPHSFLLFS